MIGNIKSCALLILDTLTILKFSTRKNKFQAQRSQIALKMHWNRKWLWIVAVEGANTIHNQSKLNVPFDFFNSNSKHSIHMITVYFPICLIFLWPIFNSLFLCSAGCCVLCWCYRSQHVCMSKPLTCSSIFTCTLCSLLLLRFFFSLV